jgi:formamidopyrimidine-DNA glycosylase
MSLNKTEIKSLRQVVNNVIAKAIKYRGTTFSNYVDSRGKKGNFSKLLRVYGREGEKCYKCSGIVKMVLKFR